MYRVYTLPPCYPGWYITRQYYAHHATRVVYTLLYTPGILLLSHPGYTSFCHTLGTPLIPPWVHLSLLPAHPEAHSAPCSPWALCSQRGAECSLFFMFGEGNEAQSAPCSPCFKVVTRRRVLSFLSVLSVPEYPTFRIPTVEREYHSAPHVQHLSTTLIGWAPGRLMGALLTLTSIPAWKEAPLCASSHRRSDGRKGGHSAQRCLS